ncbi:MAG: proteasome activator [Actinomycetota bacterium]
MTDAHAPEDAAVVSAEVVDAAPQPDVTDPAKLIRLGTMLQTVLTELQASDSMTDAGGRERLAQIHTETVEELSGILSEDLREELMEFNDCCSNEAPSAGELRVAHAQLVGWIQGLLRGMQATATAQAQMAQQQMMMMQAQAQQRQLAGQQQPQQATQQQSGPTGPDSGYL